MTGSGGFAGLNGKTGEFVRQLIGWAMAALIAYFTAQGAMRERVAALEATQKSEMQAVQQSILGLRSEMSDRLSDIKTDVREVREALRK